MLPLKNKLKQMRKIIIVAILLFINFSCSDFLDIQPRDDISIKEQFSTLEKTKLAVSGAYYKTEELMSSRFFVYADLMGGNLTFTPTATGSNTGVIEIHSIVQQVYSFSDLVNVSDFAYFYENAYAAINNTNNIIKFIDAVPDAAENQKKQIKAEALALRGFLHYNLLQLYAQTYNFSPDASHKGIVYADRTLVGGVDFPSRQTAAACYNLVVADLQAAQQLFTSEQALQGPKTSYFNPISTKALLARVALQKRDWALAASVAADVITSSGINLMDKNSYVSQWEKTNLPVSETILEFTPPSDAKDINIITSTVAQYFKYPLVANETPGRYSCALDLYNLFDNVDERKKCFRIKPLDVKLSTINTVARDFYFTKKFQDNAGTLNIRLSEMYLIAAEANMRLNNTGLALQNLNAIKVRANLNPTANTTNLLEEIFLERRRELCFEGSLFFDLMRFNKNVSRTTDCLATQCNLNFPNPKMVLPIPFSAVNVNANMIQNESY
jgi:starch-binding outer membrane protein, SusD/RagB family